jgi:hypothetical protein
MIYGSLIHILTFFLDFLTVLGAMNRDKDLEIIILRQQVRILQRKVKPPPPTQTPIVKNYSRFSQHGRSAANAG